MQKGIDSGVLKSDDKTEQGRYTRLLDAAKKQASTDRTSLAQQAKDAEKATQGQPSVGRIRYSKTLIATASAVATHSSVRALCRAVVQPQSRRTYSR